jgi:Kef-type K+ transport system membrane component KefB
VPAFSSFSVLDWFFFALSAAAFVFEAWAFVDAITRPSQAFVASSKQTKQLWLIILGVALVIGFAGALQKLSVIGILPVVAFVAAAVYLADVRPKVRTFPKNRTGASSSGPYGPW